MVTIAGGILLALLVLVCFAGLLAFIATPAGCITTVVVVVGAGLWLATEIWGGKQVAETAGALLLLGVVSAGYNMLALWWQRYTAPEDE